jgi:hypothetical protein
METRLNRLMVIEVFLTGLSAVMEEGRGKILVTGWPAAGRGVGQ